jgi:hypothetical protein
VILKYFGLAELYCKADFRLTKFGSQFGALYFFGEQKFGGESGDWRRLRHLHCIHLYINVQTRRNHELFQFMHKFTIESEAKTMEMKKNYVVSDYFSRVNACKVLISFFQVVEKSSVGVDVKLKLFSTRPNVIKTPM